MLHLDQIIVFRFQGDHVSLYLSWLEQAWSTCLTWSTTGSVLTVVRVEHLKHHPWEHFYFLPTILWHFRWRFLSWLLKFLNSILICQKSYQSGVIVLGQENQKANTGWRFFFWKFLSLERHLMIQCWWNKFCRYKVLKKI